MCCILNKTGNVANIYINTETRSCNHCYREKAISITYSKRVFVDLGIQRALLMRRIAICGLSGSKISLHVISRTARFSKNVIEHKKCVLIFSTNFVGNISHSTKN